MIPSYHAILTTILDQPRNARQIAGLVGRDYNNTRNSMARLSLLGWVDRLPDKRYAITAKGREELTRA